MHPFDIATDYNLSYEMLNMLCGKLIGEGGSRIVYDCDIKPGWVVKIEKRPETLNNMREYLLWDAGSGLPLFIA